MWGFIFRPGGLGANIFLGFLLSCSFIYYTTKILGLKINEFLYNRKDILRYKLIKKAKAILYCKKKIFIQKTRKKQVLQKSLNHLSDAINKLIDCTIFNRNVRFSILNLMLKDVSNRYNLFFYKIKKKSIFYNIGSFFIIILLALLIRFFLIEPFNIPSPSMFPTLQIGDHLFVSKLSYGLFNPISNVNSYFIRWKKPKAGDVVVFVAPYYISNKLGQNWVKRVIATEGQRVSLKNSIFYVNDRPYVHVSRDKIISFANFISNNKYAWKNHTVMKTVEKINEQISYNIYQKFLYQRNFFENNWPMNSVENKFNGLLCENNECIIDKEHVFVIGDNRGFSGDGRIWGAVPIDNIKGKVKFIFFSVDGSNFLFNIKDWFAIPVFRASRFLKRIN